LTNILFGLIGESQDQGGNWLVQQTVAIDPVTKNEIEGGSPMGYNF